MATSIWLSSLRLPSTGCSLLAPRERSLGWASALAVPSKPLGDGWSSSQDHKSVRDCPEILRFRKKETVPGHGFVPSHYLIHLHRCSLSVI